MKTSPANLVYVRFSNTGGKERPMLAIHTLFATIISSIFVGISMLSGAWGAEDMSDGEFGTYSEEQALCKRADYSILVSVHGVKRTSGTITADLHNDDPEGFLKSRARLSQTRVPAIQGITEVCIPVNRPGIYAVALYHDRDADRKFDKTWIGLPAEPYGISMDPPIRLGPPRHRDSTFQVSGPLTEVSVTLRK